MTKLSDLKSLSLEINSLYGQMFTNPPAMKLASKKFHKLERDAKKLDKDDLLALRRYIGHDCRLLLVRVQAGHSSFYYTQPDKFLKPKA